MTSMKMKFILFPAAFLLLPIIPTAAEVVTLVSDCNQFFLGTTPPQVPGVLESGNILNQNRYKLVCQTFLNQRRFVTLYDIRNRIPVFSAYKYRGQVKVKRPQNYWKIEPQLENEDEKNMILVDKNKTYNNQAGDKDYRCNGKFDRGHLFPSSYGFNKTDKMSTFTLTNVVPQESSFNKGSWNRMENCIKCIMDKYCINNNGIIEGFVVTGAQPSTNNILRDRINIPSMLWSAFCCYSPNVKSWIANAHWSDNVPDGSKSKYLQTVTLAELYQELSNADSEFNMFPGTQCPLNTTVALFYPEIKNCHCPPSTSTSGFNTTMSGPTTSGTPASSSDGSTVTPMTLMSTSGAFPSTFDPADTTSGQLPTTSDPAATTSGQLPTTSDPAATTSGQLSTTSDPLLTTSATPTATSDPFSSRSTPPLFTSGSHTVTSSTPTSTSGPATAISGVSTPISSPSGPVATTSNPISTSEFDQTWPSCVTCNT